jgi:hypothetical protein
MKAPDVWSILALAVASTSLFISWRAYRRAGARVHVRAAHERYRTYAEGQFEWDVVTVHVTNDGMAAIQVTAVELEVAGKDERAPADEGPSLRYILPGLDSEDWAINATEVAAAAGLAGGGTARVRAWVTLGNDVQKHSRWLRHTVADAR